MTILRGVAFTASWAVAALWSTRAFVWVRGMRRLPNLQQRDRRSVRRPQGCLSVVVPARNEGAAVAAGLRSLLASQTVNLEVIAVDDRSTDETGAVMDALQADALLQEQRGSTVRYIVEHVRDLPEEWLGKPHAMAQGVIRATGEWLLFTDADVIYDPEALTRALAYLEEEGGDHLLVVPTVVAQSIGEAMMMPFLHVLSIWGPRLWRVADPHSPRDSVGVGAFNLIRRSAYEAVGGWERLRMEVIEDLRMGYLIKQAGFASRVATGRNLVRIRWAHGAWGVVANLTKNVFAAFRFRTGAMIAGAGGVAVLCLLPFAGLVFSVAFGRAWLWPSLLSLMSLVALYWRFRRFADPGGPFTVLWVTFFPVASLLFLYAMMQSTVLTLARGGVVWRGTFYPLRELRAHAGPLR